MTQLAAHDDRLLELEAYSAGRNTIITLAMIPDSNDDGLLCTSGDLPETSPGDLPEK